MLPFIHAMHASDNPVKRFYDSELFDKNVIPIIYEMLGSRVRDLHYIPRYSEYKLSSIVVYYKNHNGRFVSRRDIEVADVNFDSDRPTLAIKFYSGYSISTYHFTEGALLDYRFGVDNKLLDAKELFDYLIENGRKYEYRPWSCVIL